jgi:hypothetical protein
MEKNNLLALVLLLLFGVTGFGLMESGMDKGNAIPLQDRMDLAWAQEREMTQDPATKEIPKERLIEAWQYMRSLQGGLSKAAIAGINWTERGPNNCGGRTRSVLVDLNDATRKTLWAGSVAGGLWKTTDITVTQPVWTVVNDFFANMAISTIAQAPSVPNIMYFGTGEGKNNSDAVRGIGIWKSIDGGASWAQLTSTNNSNFYYNQKVLALGNGDTIFACTKSGLYRSVNGGSTFVKVLGSGISSAGGNSSYDIERMSNGTLYTTISSGNSGGSIHKSYDNGTTWTTPLTVSISIDQVELGIATNDTSIIYGLVENNSTIPAIIKSTNGGASFAPVGGYPVDADGGISSTDFSRGQAWYDLSICVNPLNANVVFVGGVDLFKTSNGGATWQQVSHWYGGFSFQDVHADQHYAVYDPIDTSVAYFSNDGSIYRTANAGASIPTITSKEIGYNTTQFYACDIHPTAGTNYFLAGAQDNGSHQFSTAGVNATDEVTGGDGAFCHIDQNQSTYQFTSYVYNNYYRSTNGGSSFSSSGLSFSNTGRFINPSDYDDQSNVMYAAYAGGNFFRWTNPQTGSTNTTVSVTALSGGTVSAVMVSPSIANRVYFATSAGRLAYVDSANTISGTAAGVSLGNPTTNYISCIAVDPLAENHIVVTVSSYGVSSVFETHNAGALWTNIEGNLPDMPIRWVVFKPGDSTQAVLATELGVWSTNLLNGSSTNWQPSNTGLANVRCDMIKVRASDKMMIVATHGRGLYSSDAFALPTADFTISKPFTYQLAGLQFNSISSGALSYLWDFGDGTTSTLANPLKNYASAGVFSVSLTINGGVSNIVKNVTVLPLRGVPYAPIDGGNFDVNPNDFLGVSIGGTPFERGSSAVTAKSGTRSGSFAWVTGLVGNYVDQSESYLYTPSFNFTAAGTYTLKFYAKNAFELTYDGYRVEYSINEGVTWLPLATTTSAGWYDYANTSTSRPFPQNEAFFNSTNASYTLKSYATSALQGNNKVCFRFVFKSDANTVAAGLAFDDFEITGPTNPALPVSLIGFTGKRMDARTIGLTWQTASEKNVHQFEIERSFQWASVFEQVGTVKAIGNSSLKSAYTFKDPNENKTNSYYRLKMVDNDGSFEYSPIIVVNGTPSSQDKLVSAIIPSMSKNKQFIISTSSNNQVEVMLLNNNGQLMRTTSVANGQMLDCTDLPTGIYYARFTSADGKTQVEKLLVQ